MTSRRKQVLAGASFLFVLVAGLVAGAMSGSETGRLTDRMVDASGDEHLDLDEASLPTQFQLLAFRATCHNTEAPGRVWAMAFDGRDQFISTAIDESDMTDEVLLVHGTENIRWLPLLDRVEVYEYTASVPRELRAPVVGNAIDTASRLTGLAGSTVFSASELRDAITAGRVQLISKGMLRGMPTLQLRVAAGPDVYTDVWVHADYGIRLDAYRYDSGAVAMNWRCEDVEVPAVVNDAAFELDIPSGSVKETLRVVLRNSASGRAILARHGEPNIMVVPESKQQAVVEWYQYTKRDTPPINSWAVVDTLANAIVIQAPDGASLPFAGLPEWGAAGQAAKGKSGWAPMNIQGVDAATWTVDNIRTLIVGSDPSSVGPLAESIRSATD